MTTITTAAFPSAGLAPSQPAYLPTARVRPVAVRRNVLWQVAAAVVPAMALFATGRLYPAGRWLFLAASLLGVWNVFCGRPRAALALLAGLLPATALLRPVFFYSASPLLMAAAVLAVLANERGAAARVRNNVMLTGFVIAALLYWWTSVLAGGAYDVNMRVVDLALSATAICLLGQTRGYLYTALGGLAITAFAVAAGFLPYGTRLGEGTVAGKDMGNPISLGLSVALVFLLTLTEEGRWIFAAPNRYRRLICSMAAAACLVLSTSRGSWLVALGGWLLIFFLDRGSRGTSAVTLLCGVLAVILLLQSGRSANIRKYFDMTVSTEESADKITSGRADQWESFPRVFADSPLWGFGPGSGKSVSLRYTLLGKPWHSLYLQVGVELGLIGLGALAWLLIALLRRTWRLCRFSGEVVPLVGVVAFMLIGVSVTAMDEISGIYLGLAFLAVENWRKRPARTALWAVESAERRFS